MAAGEPLTISAVVPTYGRERVLVETLSSLFELEMPPDEILVVDQTVGHEPEIVRDLERLERAGSIRWLRLERPSIPRAMNLGLLAARGELVLFLDDDIVPLGELVASHRESHRQSGAEIVSGQVLQPEEVPEPLAGERFAFRSSLAQEVDCFMGGNVSFDRRFLLALGGVDERFHGAAYRFEAELAARARRSGGRIWYEPAAAIRHLRAPRGGTRGYGSHLTTFRPHHAVGEYYFLFRVRPAGWLGSALRRYATSVMTRHHLARPWWIPVTLMAESLGALWAAALALRPPGLLPPEARRTEAG